MQNKCLRAIELHPFGAILWPFKHFSSIYYRIIIPYLMASRFQFSQLTCQYVHFEYWEINRYKHREEILISIPNRPIISRYIQYQLGIQTQWKCKRRQPDSGLYSVDFMERIKKSKHFLHLCTFGNTSFSQW